MPLWNHALSTQTYQVYSSTTYQNTGLTQPLLGGSSSLCLSCHDGTVAPNQTYVYGKISVSGSMADANNLQTNLQSSHPFSLAIQNNNNHIKDAPDLAATLANGTTLDSTVHLVKGNVECNSCHDPHVQGIDHVSPNFLVRDSSSGQLCLACHDPSRTMSGKVNPLTDWASSAHALASSVRTTIPVFGSYSTVATSACMACHQPHKAAGAATLLRAANPAIANLDAVAEDCSNCHNGGGNISPAAPNILSEYAKMNTGSGSTLGTAHPWSTSGNLHTSGEGVLLNQNRHATCVDCHAPHSPRKVTSFSSAPAIRLSQTDTPGISESDGVTVLTPAVNQYQVCLRCHGESSRSTTPTSYGYTPVRRFQEAIL